jgi:hypothetical protein
MITFFLAKHPAKSKRKRTGEQAITSWRGRA